MDMYNKQEKNDAKIVLCGASAYEKKYYFNEDFKALPESIKEELHIICVLFTEEVGGVFTVVFDEDGQIALETDAYDEGYSSSSCGYGCGKRRYKGTVYFCVAFCSCLLWYVFCAYRYKLCIRKTCGAKKA